MRKSFAIALPLLLLATSAQAHTGHGTGGALAGLLHPLTGLDHLLAMVMVGLWAALLADKQSKSVWLMPAAFLSAMVAGALSALAGLALPAVELAIVGSVVVLGVLLLAAVRLDLVLGMIIVAGFALMHGYAHGREIPDSASPFAYAAGFLAATAILHAIGVVAGTLLLRRGGAMALRAIGAAGATAGLVLAAGV